MSRNTKLVLAVSLNAIALDQACKWTVYLASSGSSDWGTSIGWNSAFLFYHIAGPLKADLVAAAFYSASVLTLGALILAPRYLCGGSSTEISARLVIARGLIGGGLFSMGIDLVVHGGAINYLGFHLSHLMFGLADICIIAGMVAFALSLIRRKPKALAPASLPSAASGPRGG